VIRFVTPANTSMRDGGADLQFREVLAGRDTRVTELEQPVFAWK